MSHKPYMPVLKWRLAEYQALFKLDIAVKQAIFPLFIVPPIEYDFETGENKKNPQEHIEPLIRRIENKWGMGSASLELHESLHTEYWDESISIPQYLFSSLQSSKTNIQPSIRLSFDSNYIDLAVDYSKVKGCGLLIRIRFEELADSSKINALSALITSSNLNPNLIDLVIDFDAKTEFLPFERISFLTSHLLNNVNNYLAFRSIYFTGISLNFSSVSVNTQNIQAREYWGFYKSFFIDFIKKIPQLGFGDFTIEPPEFAPSMDMRKIKPAARLIYSTDNNWIVYKGSAFRDNPGQMYDICSYFVLKSGFFMGESFSNGDMRIYQCANRNGTNGNLTTWKQAGINHHITLVVQQLANLTASQMHP